VWFDIPVADLDRAIAFYAAVLGVKVHKERLENFSMGVLEHAGRVVILDSEGNRIALHSSTDT
jgi:predicted enzyme related to lactoylglutathione lyase